MTMQSILPPNATPLERALEASFAARLDALSVSIGQLMNPATCPVALLPWLAWALSVDDWDPAWPEARQRAVVAASIAVHRGKGTIAAIKGAMAAMGYGDVTLTEGRGTMVGGNWQVGSPAVPVGGADHWAEYWIAIDRPIPPQEVAKIARRLADVAPARCRLTRIRVASVQTVVGGPWAVGDPAITVGSTYAVEMMHGTIT